MIIIFKVFGIGFLLVFLSFIVWMNITPGHFQTPVCGCSIEYRIVKRYGPQCSIGCLPGSKSNMIMNFLKRSAASFDFNK
jgi:hypothetical protein